MNDKKHELLSEIKRIASELGRTPTRDEFLGLSGKSHRSYEVEFGSYSVFVTAANLDPVRKSKAKQKFDDIEADLGYYWEKQPKKQFKLETVCIPLKSSQKILVIGDIHFPWVCLDSLSMIYELCRIIQPTHIVQVGDIADYFAYSKFPRTMNTYSPQQETEMYYMLAAGMWRKLKSLSPLADCYQLHGNHTDRAYKRMIEKAPELEHMIDFKKWLTFPGVHLVPSSRDELIINDIAFIHGYLSQLGAHRDHMLRNVVCGHSHVGGVSYRNINGKILWELNAGYIGDPDSKALSYTAQRSIKWTKGCGYIDDFGPRFIPFL